MRRRTRAAFIASALAVAGAIAVCTIAGPASAAFPCPSRNAAAQLLAAPIARHGIASVRLGNRKVVVGTYLLASVNAISALRGDRCSVNFTVTLFPSDAGRLFQREEPRTPVWAANADLFDNHDVTAIVVHRHDGWHVDERDLLPWIHR
jgi:hypothetical protein